MQETRQNKISRLFQKELATIFQEQTRAWPDGERYADESKSRFGDLYSLSERFPE